MRYIQANQYQHGNNVPYHPIMDESSARRVYAPSYNPIRTDVLQMYGGLTDDNDQPEYDNRDIITRTLENIIMGAISIPLVILGGLQAGDDDDSNNSTSDD